jgi:hypothetical protein
MLSRAYKAGSYEAEEAFLERLSGDPSFEKVSWAALRTIGSSLMGTGARAGTSSIMSGVGSGARAAWGAGMASRPVSAAKFMLGMGGKTRLGKNLSFWGASPLTFGGVGAATAEEGERGEAFMKGVAGGLLFNVGMRGGEKLVGGGLLKALKPKAGIGLNAFTKHTAKSVKAHKGLMPKGVPPPQAGEYAVGFKQLGAADKLRRGSVATGTALGGMAGGFGLSMAADPLVNIFSKKNVPYKVPPMTHVNNPYNPVYYR